MLVLFGPWCCHSLLGSCSCWIPREETSACLQVIRSESGSVVQCSCAGGDVVCCAGPADWTVSFRAAMDKAGFKETAIIIPDGGDNGGQHSHSDWQAHVCDLL